MHKLKMMVKDLHKLCACMLQLHSLCHFIVFWQDAVMTGLFFNICQWLLSYSNH